MWIDDSKTDVQLLQAAENRRNNIHIFLEILFSKAWMPSLKTFAERTPRATSLFLLDGMLRKLNKDDIIVDLPWPQMRSELKYQSVQKQV